ncbi:DUF4267 domain-containing protein [Spiractinospora alimapuensis]|uniref:DUF4267 domain-containing protein n=1 Tax=Spiractinospora alimapuensis TaxID=2820884 RepID=UPI001F1ED9B4|nr:DUF4267 domain-containing protein [Spiractinospora alimapuensis]QVQ54320.1 DUF4267 domain-containing protein [Spiractinospora alimapuensis]
MVTTVATVLAGLIGAGVFFLGVVGLSAPRFAAGFGIPHTPTEDPTFRSWLAVKAVRDLGAGLFILIVLVGGSTHLLGWLVLAATVIPTGDALIVLRGGGPRSAVYGVHGATALAVLVVGVLLLVG